MPTNTPQSKAEKREAARAEALALRQAQEARDKRTRLITIVALVVGVIALVGLGAYILSQGDDPIDPEAPLEGVSAPSTANENGGIPIGAEGVAGTTTPGAPEVAVYLDYACPACGQFEAANGASLDALLEAGEITLVLHPVSILDRNSGGSQYSTRAAATTAFIADRAPEYVNDFNQLLFANQPGNGANNLTDDQLAEIALQAGVPQEVADGIADGQPQSLFGRWVQAGTVAAGQNPVLVNDNGGFGTPTITIDGERFNDNWSDPTAIQRAVQGDAG